MYDQVSAMNRSFVFLVARRGSPRKVSPFLIGEVGIFI